MTIKQGSLLGRWYGYWVKKGGQPLSKDWERNLARENLCHFVRIMVIWAPLRWFFLVRTKTVIAPWSICLTVACIVGLWINPGITLKIMAILGAYAAVMFGVSIWLVKADKFLTTYIGRPIKKFFGWKIIGRLYFWFLLAAASIALGIYYVPEVMLFIAIVIFWGLVIFVAFAIVAGIIILATKFFEYEPVREVTDVVIEYIKAKKSKICPLLFVEID